MKAVNLSTTVSAQKLKLDHAFFLPENNTFQYTNDYKSVTQFIRKNKNIPEKLREFSGSPKINELCNCILSGKLDEFNSDPNTQLYSLFLLNEQKISIAHFTTINIYLIVLMECTEKQRLKEKDNKHKKRVKVGLESCKDECVKEAFISHLLSRFKTMGRIITREDLEEKINALTPDADIVIALQKDVVLDPLKETFDRVDGLILFSDRNYYYIPSAQLAHIALSFLQPKYFFQMAPIFGNISPTTLYRMHQKGFHPISLYSPLVSSNPEYVHRAVRGPLEIALHDYAFHMEQANHLNEKASQFIFQYLVPRYTLLIKDKIAESLKQEDDFLSQCVDVYFKQSHDQITHHENQIGFILHTMLVHAPVYLRKDIVDFIFKDKKIIQEKRQFDIEKDFFSHSNYLRDPIILRCKPEIVEEKIDDKPQESTKEMLAQAPKAAVKSTKHNTSPTFFGCFTGWCCSTPSEDQQNNTHSNERPHLS